MSEQKFPNRSYVDFRPMFCRSAGLRPVHQDPQPRSHPRHPAQAMSANAGGYRFEEWEQAMSAGDFSLGWHINDISKQHWPSAHRLWKGRSSAGDKLLVRCLHGLGDAVQMLRYAPQLSALAAGTVFEVPAGLLPLAPYFRGVTQIASVESYTPRWTRGMQIEIMEAPYLFRTSLSQLPLSSSYLTLPSTAIAERAASMGKRRKPRVGLVWSGGDWDRERWIPLRRLEPLLALQQLEFWNLQGGAAAKQAQGLALKTSFHYGQRDLAALAATISNLDLIITVDTLAAHLAGALGIPAWVLLKHKADWRWLVDRSDSPWYPSLRLFRQPAPGSWDEVVTAVREELAVTV